MADSDAQKKDKIKDKPDCENISKGGEPLAEMSTYLVQQGNQSSSDGKLASSLCVSEKAKASRKAALAAQQMARSRPKAPPKLSDVMDARDKLKATTDQFAAWRLTSHPGQGKAMRMVHHSRRPLSDKASQIIFQHPAAVFFPNFSFIILGAAEDDLDEEPPTLTASLDVDWYTFEGAPFKKKGGGAFKNHQERKSLI